MSKMSPVVRLMVQDFQRKIVEDFDDEMIRLIDLLSDSKAAFVLINASAVAIARNAFIRTQSHTRHGIDFSSWFETFQSDLRRQCEFASQVTGAVGFAARAEDADVIVCKRASESSVFSDDAFGECCHCGERVRLRPYNKIGKKLICLECAASEDVLKSMIREDGH